MDSVGVNIIETAALGRPFQLGMLYDCRKDALIPGITLWDKEQLQQSIRAQPQINTSLSVTASDSIEEKSHLLNIDGCLKLSLLGGLVNVGGAAKYLSDTKKSFKQQRLTLHYHSTTKFEALTMNHLASKNIEYYEVFDNDTATHVVTALLYGADAYFVFDREVSSDEDKSTVEGEVKAAFEKLKVISVGAQIDLSMDDNQKTAVKKLSCKFHGDFQLPSNPASFEDALRVFADLPKLLGDNKELAVPLRVWLYPLDKLHSSAAKLQKEIHTGLIRKVESVIESLNITEMHCSDLLKDIPSLVFAGFRNKILHLKQNCSAYKLSLMKNLGSLLPKIRGDMEKETALADLLCHHEKCPFRESDLQQWIKEKEMESLTIKTLLKQLNDSETKVEENLDEILMDLDVENVVSYTFTSFEWPDVLLLKQKVFLSPSTMNNNDGNAPDAEQKTVFTANVKMTLRKNLIIFKNLIKSKTSKSTKFIVISKEMENLPGSCILLYENGSEEATCFIPPLKPACPVTEQITSDRVVAKVSPSCPATEELKLLYKMKEEKDWKYQSVLQGQSTVTLTDLRPDTEYEIKCAAVGKLNYTVDSDVIRVTTHPNNIREV
ncbi:stonustoxin subunit beta-like [Garra rufa]|uniref:stonustoxin subunit beta-like n=1 Tax=Garra rufa TaxID=137080 RepID=UPI003CCEF700